MPAHGLLYFSAGLLSLADLRRMSNRAWAESSGGTEPLAGFSPWEEDLYRRVVRPGDRICVIGCGSGRDLRPFLGADHEVVGVEPSPEPAAALRRILRDTQQTAQVIEGFIEDVALPGAFDVFIFSLNCYSYIPRSARRIAMLRRLQDHLRPGARVVLSYVGRVGNWGGTAVRLAGCAARIARTDLQWEQHDVVMRVNAGPEPALGFTHCFVATELEREVEQAGFSVREHGDDPWAPPFVVITSTLGP
jgi:SAM-dependent methyltransferase